MTEAGPWGEEVEKETGPHDKRWSRGGALGEGVRWESGTWGKEWGRGRGLGGVVTSNPKGGNLHCF